MSMLHKVKQRVLDLWASAQVELHGHYSVERLHQLQQYSAKFSLGRLLCVLLATPWPCLLTIVAIDSVPLDPPSLGTNKNVVFWVRSTVAIAIFTLAFVVQFHKALPMVSLPRIGVLLTTCVVTGGTQLSGYAMSLLIGFPVPFGLVLESPVWLVLLIGSLAAGSQTIVRSDPEAWASLRDWAMVGALQISILFVYPLYNYAFISASSYGQTGLSLVLGVIKLAYKNAINMCIREQPDLKAEVINFNVEISNALFVTFSMQNATSIATLIVLILVDFLHASVTFYEVRHATQMLHRLEIKMLRNQTKRRMAITRLDGDSVELVDPKTRTFVQRASAILSREGIEVPSGPQLKLYPRKPRLPVKPRRLWSRPKMMRNLAIVPLSKAHPSLLSLKIAVTAEHYQRSSKKIPIQSLSLSQAERDYIMKSLALLHMTEFTVLTEFIEFVVPCIYAMYVAVMAYLPNRVYFPQLASLDQSNMAHTLAKMLLYGLLELLSLFVLDWMLRRQLKFSPLAQLAFVLETQWKSVQAELVLWVVYIVQSSLQHHGVDYSFKFAWLHENSKS